MAPRFRKHPVWVCVCVWVWADLELIALVPHMDPAPKHTKTERPPQAGVELKNVPRLTFSWTCWVFTPQIEHMSHVSPRGHFVLVPPGIPVKKVHVFAECEGFVGFCWFAEKPSSKRRQG